MISSLTTPSPLLIALRQWLSRSRRARTGQTAAALAFTTLLSLVPLVAVGVAVFAQLPMAEKLGVVLRSFLQDNLLPDKAGRVIASYALQFSQKASRLTVIGLGMLAVTALSLLATIDRAFNAIFGVHKPRRWWRRLLLYVAALLLGPLAMGGSIAASTYLLSVSLGLVNEPEWLRTATLKLLPLILMSGFIGFLYYAVPNCPVRARSAWVGGMLATLGLWLLQRGLAWFLAAFPTWSLIYGTFAVVPIFLVWLYLSWMLLLLGASVVAGLSHGQPGRRRRTV